MSEDDRELTELAAKAAGEEVEWLPYAKAFYRKAYDWPRDKGFFVPLHDDGEALRLAVLLNLHVQIDFNEDPAAVYIYGGWIGEVIEESIEECRFKAVRRAIVRAAAEIGKATA